MDKAIYAAQVYKYPVGGNVLDNSFEYLPFFELADNLLFLFWNRPSGSRCARSTTSNSSGDMSSNVDALAMVPS